MKVFLVLVLALACTSAVSIPKTPVALKDVKSPNVIEGRITNGHLASSTVFPYVVGLLLISSSELSWCGGSLIGKSWILTAAHCTDGIKFVRVYLGSTDRYAGKIVYDVTSSSIIKHPQYNRTIIANDLALIKIPEVTYTDEIYPIRLPSFFKQPLTYVNKYATASGWGDTEDLLLNGLSGPLKYIHLRVTHNDKCAETYVPDVITKNTLCVDITNDENICDGDSGGPLVYKAELIGVASSNFPAGCLSAYPSIFVRVTSYIDWIKQQTCITAESY